ncbi:MAG TPA: kelch repeat-containing protein, partial [Planctomycetota bacterium]|nr:kelch repeat-containing protein [Planctomycetota bacterium]
WELADTGVGGNLAWTLVSPAAGSPIPPARTYPAAAYHDRLNRLFLMGGLAPGAVLGDAWMFDFSTRVWTQLGNAPSTRYGAAMVYDPSLDRLVLTGGANTTSLDDIWECDGTTWTRRATAGKPSPRNNHSFAYDRANHRAVLFGGHDGQTALNDTWSYDGSQWTPIIEDGPSPAPRFTHAACFVEQGASTVVFGGTTDGIGELGDTWRLDQAGRWTPGALGPPARVNPAMVYAIVQGQPSCLLFGGYRQGSLLGDTWRYLPASDTWQQLAGGPDARDIHAMAWDRMRNVVVLFGGRAVNAFFADDTWEFNCATATWSLRNPVHRPPARWNGTMDFDQSRGRTVLFGGYNGGYLNDVWEWNGTDWEQRVPETDAPVGREDATMIYDADRGRMAMFGGWTGASHMDDLWFLNARIDRAGAGNTAQPTELHFYTQPALGQQLQLGFANPQGFGFYTVGFGPLQQPLGPLPVPPLCEPSSIWATFASYLVIGSAEPNIAWNVPNTPLILGVTLVFQAFSVQPASCWRATDALHVHF